MPRKGFSRAIQQPVKSGFTFKQIQVGTNACGYQLGPVVLYGTPRVPPKLWTHFRDYVIRKLSAEFAKEFLGPNHNSVRERASKMDRLVEHNRNLNIKPASISSML